MERAKRNYDKRQGLENKDTESPRFLRNPLTFWPRLGSILKRRLGKTPSTLPPGTGGRHSDPGAGNAENADRGVAPTTENLRFYFLIFTIFPYAYVLITVPM